MTTNNHEVIFAIVNSGFAEDVMEIAREQGARGGTILNARGVAREEAAAFFGITIHAEKEILMMVVEKDIRDNVLNAIYREMGMAKAAQGIAFSLPVSDVAGLAQKIEPEKKED
ncbi:MAG: P-II family nitrogen regulator [Ruminococcaceae bacterium]|nr:P-II family nitrogen regulator [Oscillospiraceae bacterium]